jgi:endo-1,4-beta-xylanase
LAYGDEVSRLREIGSSKNLLVGSAVSNRELHDPAFTTLLAEQASIVVPENEMKWQVIEPAPDQFDFSRGDALLTFAQEHQQKLRGHNLCWHEQLPNWFASVATPQNAGDLLRRHIAAVAGHYNGHIQSWDVVNEAVRVEDGRPDGLRKSAWLQLLGPDYIGVAFRAAREADPKAILTYNDYDIEQDGPKFDAKRKAVLQLLTSLREQKLPIQAVGLQSHLKAHHQLPDWTAMHGFMSAIEKLDLSIFVTELDVDDSELPDDVNERDAAVAQIYGDYLRNILQHKSVKAVLTWGLTDGDSWLNSPARRKNGRAQRPLPFDSDLKPKPAFYAMVDAVKGAPAR